jgi:hypothetical protein
VKFVRHLEGFGGLALCIFELVTTEVLVALCIATLDLILQKSQQRFWWPCVVQQIGLKPLVNFWYCPLVAKTL